MLRGLRHAHVEPGRRRVTPAGLRAEAADEGEAAEIRAARPPEPYNGKGVKYVDEVIIRKQGKVFGS